MLSLSLILIILGYSIGEASYSIIGFVFLFLLSTSVLIPNNMDIPTGVDINTTYTYNSSGTLLNADAIEVDTFSNPNTRFYGIWLSIIAGAGTFLVWNFTKGGEFEDG